MRARVVGAGSGVGEGRLVEGGGFMSERGPVGIAQLVIEVTCAVLRGLLELLKI